MADYATLLRDHVTLTCRSVDRMFLQAWVPKLQSVGQVCTFLRWQRGFKIPSSAAFGKIGDGFVKDVERFAKEHGIPLVHFKKGENKEEFVRPYIDAAAAEGGDGKVVLIGIAQEKASVWRSWKAKGHEHRRPPAHGVGPADGDHQPLLLLPVGPGLGPGVLEDQRLCPVSRCGCISTGMSGPSASSTRPASATRRSTTGSGPVRPPRLQTRL